MIEKKRLLTLSGRLLVACLIVIAFSLLSMTATAQEPNIPLTTPDAITGLEIFAERCATCHGPNGEGNGEMAVNLPTPPANFTDPEFRKTMGPGTMFATVFNGKFDVGMPPFGPGTENSNPMSVANIWDVIGAVYSLATPAESVEQGQVIYEDNCSACHGETGAGDGPDATDAEDVMLDLTDLSYWFNRSNETVFEAIKGGDIPEHAYSLSEDDLWTVVDYARTFSYGYVDPFAPIPPIESATVTGEVRNGTTDEPFAGAMARLRAFTPSFEETVNMTTTVDIDGRFYFDLEEIPHDWVYLTSVTYGDLNFSSDAGQLSRSQPELDLPITVYEQTTDPGAIFINQMHVMLDFFDGGVAVTELYVFGNQESAVFVGETGQVEDGTVRFALPDEAENISFERAMGSFESTVPATEIIQNENGWADTLPIRPGPSGLNLIVQYELPYEDGVDLTHPLMYNASNATVILPDVGVEVDQGGWAFQGAQQMGGGASFLAYDRPGIPAGSMELSLRGNLEAPTTGNAAVEPRNQTSELLIGGGLFLIVVAVGFYVMRTWQTGSDSDEEDLYEDEVDSGDDVINRLLQAIADLDAAHEAGEIEEGTYTTQREHLKSELKLLWE